jgi:putative CocE/NonD family hydrolase
MRKVGAAIVLLLAALIGGLWLTRRRLLAKALGLPPPRYPVRVERGVNIAMPDGVLLVADHYYPKAEGDFPTLLRRTPYGRNGNLSLLGPIDDLRARVFAERGYHVINQDVRGRGDSAGEFAPLENERADGMATLDWISCQPWFNGAVGLWGESYNGFTQWALTRNAPPYLKALVPAISSAEGYRSPYSAAGAFNLLGRLYWIKGIEATRQMQPWYKTDFGNMNASLDDSEAALMHLPLQEIDTLVLGYALPYYRRQLAHPDRTDDYWRAINFHDQLPELEAAVHLVGGWYDLYLDTTLRDYAALKQGRHNPYLTIGPWVHGIEPLLETLRQALPWFETHLKGEAGQLRDNAVRYYLMGANEWREADSWPPPCQPTHYYLHSGGNLSTAVPGVDDPPDTYQYDPSNPTPSVGGNLLSPPSGSLDNQALEARGDVLSYTTPPLATDLDVIGPVCAELYVHSSLAQTDFFARLCDVYPDGRSMNICDGLVRVTPSLGEMRPAGSLRLEIDMIATAQRFMAGHRLRLQVSSGAFPRYNRNHGADEPLATATQIKVASQTVYHDSAQPSALLLPVQPAG